MEEDRRTSLAAERTLRRLVAAGFTTIAVTLALGGLPTLIHPATRWPYVVVGTGFALPNCGYPSGGSPWSPMSEGRDAGDVGERSVAQGPLPPRWGEAAISPKPPLVREQPDGRADRPPADLARRRRAALASAAGGLGGRPARLSLTTHTKEESWNASTLQSSGPGWPGWSPPAT